MPERLATPLQVAHATTDLLLAGVSHDRVLQRDLLEPSTLHSLGNALARTGDERSLRLIELSAHRASRGATALRNRLSSTGDEAELASVTQVATMFRMVAAVTRAYRGSAAGSGVPVNRLVADAAMAVGEQVTPDSVDRVRSSLVITQQLLDRFRRDAEADSSPELDLRLA